VLGHPALNPAWRRAYGPAGSHRALLEQLFRVVPPRLLALGCSSARDDGSHGVNVEERSNPDGLPTLLSTSFPGRCRRTNLHRIGQLRRLLLRRHGTHAASCGFRWHRARHAPGEGHLPGGGLPAGDGSSPAATSTSPPSIPPWVSELWKATAPSSAHSLSRHPSRVLTLDALRSDALAALLYIFANDGAHGFQPWVVPRGAALSLTSFVDVEGGDSSGNGNGPLGARRIGRAGSRFGRTFPSPTSQRSTATAAAEWRAVRRRGAAYARSTSKEQRSSLAPVIVTAAEL
jgi:hypothetical protein